MGYQWVRKGKSPSCQGLFSVSDYHNLNTNEKENDDDDDDDEAITNHHHRGTFTAPYQNKQAAAGAQYFKKDLHA